MQQLAQRSRVRWADSIVLECRPCNDSHQPSGLLRGPSAQEGRSACSRRDNTDGHGDRLRRRSVEHLLEARGRGKLRRCHPPGPIGPMDPFHCRAPAPPMLAWRRRAPFQRRRRATEGSAPCSIGLIRNTRSTITDGSEGSMFGWGRHRHARTVAVAERRAELLQHPYQGRECVNKGTVLAADRNKRHAASTIGPEGRVTPLPSFAPGSMRRSSSVSREVRVAQR